MVVGSINQAFEQAGLQGQAMAASEAMIVSGLEKELRMSPLKINFEDQAINIKELNAAIETISGTWQVNAVKKEEEKKEKQQKENDNLPKKKAPKTVIFSTKKEKPFAWIKQEGQQNNGPIKKPEHQFANIAEAIKNYILDNLDPPEKLAELLLKNDKSAYIVSLSLFNRNLYPVKTKQPSALPGKMLSHILQDNLNFDALNIDDLLALAKTLGVSETANLAGSNNTNVINDNASAFFDELRLLEVSRLMEDNFFKRLLIARRKKKVVMALLKMEIDPNDIARIEKQARVIAWAKSIATLKDFHLKRIFTNSMREFGKYSRKIDYYTKKSRSLGYDLDKRGIQWVEARIETLTQETAEYKLQLLQSLQAIEFEEQRKKDISNLQATIKHLKHAH